nr:MAG TPA: hypothetical protein [Caudoviricetes sp.]DAN57337.1 MAG TPA: hypothetical protein [Caudoviricetes sp.]
MKIFIRIFNLFALFCLFSYPSTPFLPFYVLCHKKPPGPKDTGIRSCYNAGRGTSKPCGLLPFRNPARLMLRSA